MESQNQTHTLFITPYKFSSPEKIIGAVLSSLYNTKLQSPSFDNLSIKHIWNSPNGKETILEFSPKFENELKSQEWRFLQIDFARSIEPVCIISLIQSIFHYFANIIKITLIYMI